MGLTGQSTGRRAAREDWSPAGDGVVIALAGNPNVGKSTVFNSLTGLKQHTGNWTGKTVANAFGRCRFDPRITVADLPGTYSLAAHSEEERVARDFLCFEKSDAVIVVCDATCLERNLNLVLQTLEITRSGAVCVNLMDEARRNGVHIDIERLSGLLGVPVVATEARAGKGVRELLQAVVPAPTPAPPPYRVRYPEPLEAALIPLERALSHYEMPARWLALRLLEDDGEMLEKISERLRTVPTDDSEVGTALSQARELLEREGVDADRLTDLTVQGLLNEASRIYSASVTVEENRHRNIQRLADRLLTGKVTGTLVMLLMLLGILWLTISGANYPSEWLSRLLFGIGDRINDGLHLIGAPEWLCSALIDGVWQVLAWVTSVMLPPMAIFFPLFTLLEDAGYLPRVAFNLDGAFKRCNACGKQALTMCMGFGCNAAGVVGCRIIDSPREKRIAVLTNAFVPCNGRFPMMITIISAFFVVSSTVIGSVASAAMLTGVIVFGVLMTFAVSKLLSVTLLKGTPSSFTLELPPFRRPQIMKVLVRSVFDRTLFVLGRAVSVAAPAGLLIWCLANIECGGGTLLQWCCQALDPIGRVFGMDGVIMMAFILGMPANEIVIPIAVMAYVSSGTLVDITDIGMLRELLIANGWTSTTALCVLIFSLMHWPCTTTLLTVKKETGSMRDTLLAFAIPSVCGLLCCLIVNGVSLLFS